MSILFIRLYYKEARMSDPKNGNSGSDRERKSDRGGTIRGPLGDTAIGQRPTPNRPTPPKPQHPHK